MYKTDFKNLYIWQKALRLVREIYIITDLFPSKEPKALTSICFYLLLSTAILCYITADGIQKR